MSIDPTATSYDELPYGDNFFPYTHPDYLAAVGRLHGIETADPATARVLELGCAGGGNLIPMAAELPGARFIGVDLSPRQIEAGRALIARVGLENIALEAASIADVDEASGPFDYIICHGVYSWVPGPIRDKILDVIGRCLAPEGVAYLSYNTYPGWHARGMVREILEFHVRGEPTATGRVEKARRFLDDLNTALPDPTSAYATILRKEGESLRDVTDAYLYHEHLEETNQPVYFADLMLDAGARGLGFLAEARSAGLMANMPPESREALARWAEDRVEAEQYLDFLCNRTFRRTLLRHADRGTSVPSIHAVPGFWITTNVRPASSDPSPSPDSPEEFRRLDGEAGLTTNNPALKSALHALHDHPTGPIRFADLAALVLAADPETVPEPGSLERALLRCFLSNLVEFHVHPPRGASPLPDRPRPSPLAKAQAEAGPRVVSDRRRSIRLPDFDRAVLVLLDGERDEAAIFEALMVAVESGEFTLNRGDEPVADLEVVREVLRAELGLVLRRLADQGLLVG